MFVTSEEPGRKSNVPGNSLTRREFGTILSRPRRTPVPPPAHLLSLCPLPAPPAVSATATACQGRGRDGRVPYPGASFKRPHPCPGARFQTAASLPVPSPPRPRGPTAPATSPGWPPLKVWVDCTAAAHPLGPPPDHRAAGSKGGPRGLHHRPRVRADRGGILDRLGIAYTVGRRATAAPRRVRQGARRSGARSAQLARLVWQQRPQLALAHGSVDLAVVSSLYRIPSAQMQDYEFANLQRQIAFRAARRVLMPDSDPGRATGEARRQGR